MKILSSLFSGFLPTETRRKGYEEKHAAKFSALSSLKAAREERERKEKERIEKEVKKNENMVFIEIKQNLWRKWRGKLAINERRDKVPTEIEKVEIRMNEIEKRILEIKLEEEKVQKKAANTKKAKEEGREKRERMKNTWMMMGWLHSFIEKNKYNWERRRTVQEKEKEQQDE